jgi:hypothetical protein
MMECFHNTAISIYTTLDPTCPESGFPVAPTTPIPTKPSLREQRISIRCKATLLIHKGNLLVVVSYFLRHKPIYSGLRVARVVESEAASVLPSFMCIFSGVKLPTNDG